MTRGVRADRVGVERHSGRARKLASGFRPSRKRGRNARSSKGGTPLACEHSAGDQLARVHGFGRARATAVPPALDDGALGGEARKRAPSTALSERDGNRSVSAAVLADCVGCRNRRAALGPRSKDRGSSGSSSSRKAKSAPREQASEAGSRWRKPPARVQRDRWRVPRDPTRERESVLCDRGREHSVDGRRPDPTKSSPLTRRLRRRISGGGKRRGSGGAQARLGPRNTVTEDVRGDIAHLARREQRRDREAARGGVSDRDSTRTTRRRTHERSRREPRDAKRVALRRSPKLEVRRQARLHLAGSYANGPAGTQPVAQGRRHKRPRMSRHTRRFRRKTDAGWRAPGVGQSGGAR